MARRHRTRTRTRRGAETARTTAAPVRAEREEARTSRPAHRAVRSSRAGTSRAMGAPSAALERSAVGERSFVLKDFRRLAVVVAVAVVILIIAGLLESVLIK